METLNDLMHWLTNLDDVLDVVKKAAEVISKLLAVAAILFNALFRTARKFSPGTGLAPGYYKNFLVPVMSATDGPSEVLIWMSPGGNLLTKNRSQFEDSGNGKTNLPNYVNVTVGDGQHSRTLLVATRSDGTTFGLDFPRTLTGDLPSLIEGHPARWLRWLGGTDAVQRRELRNFWETLSDYIHADIYQTRIKAFCGSPESAQTEARPPDDWSKMLDDTIPKPNIVLRLLGF